MSAAAALIQQLTPAVLEAGETGPACDNAVTNLMSGLLFLIPLFMLYLRKTSSSLVRLLSLPECLTYVDTGTMSPGSSEQDLGLISVTLRTYQVQLAVVHSLAIIFRYV